MLVLTVIQGPDKGRKFELPRNEPQLLGRSSEALPLSDTTVSRRHAELTPDEGKWYLRDLGSQNGTWVNGVRIAERTLLKAGDQIRTGATLFVFGSTDDEEQELDLVRIVRAGLIDTSVERTLLSNDDSVILAEPEPRSAAIHHLQVIYRLTALTTHLTDAPALLQGVMDLVFREFKPERGCILLADPDRPKEPPRPAVVRVTTASLAASAAADPQDAQIHISRTILQHALTKGEGVLSSNAMTDPRFRAGDSVQRFNIRSAICSPIEFMDRRVGAIYIDSSIANYTFTPEQLALMNAIGRHTGLALATTEAYDKKVQTERLAAIGTTVAAVSHSIKNILQGLRGGADVVEMGLKKEDLKISRGGWTILKRNLDRIMGLTLNMLAYSRARTLEIELTKVGPLLEDCAALLADACHARQVALLVDVDPEMPPVPLDPNLMHQALMNLMGNAVEAVEPESGVVTVRAEYSPGRVAASPTEVLGRPMIKAAQSANSASGGWSGAEVRISIIDNGPGIPADRLDAIFEPFHTTKGSRGTGLGLAVTKRVVEDHGGRIIVTSGTAKGSPSRGGATFTIVLPADASRAVDPSATAASS